MGSKRAWGGALLGTVGYAAGRYLDKKDKKNERLKAELELAKEKEKEKEKAQDNSTGGEDPFTTAAKKKKVNTLLASSNVGALSGAGSSQGALTLGS